MFGSLASGLQQEYSQVIHTVHSSQSQVHKHSHILITFHIPTTVTGPTVIVVGHITDKVYLIRTYRSYFRIHTHHSNNTSTTDTIRLVSMGSIVSHKKMVKMVIYLSTSQCYRRSLSQVHKIFISLNASFGSVD